MGGNADTPSRQGYRFRVGIPAETEIGGKTIACDAQNLSRSGALLVGQFPTPLPEVVDVALKAPTGSMTVQLSGRVIRIEADGAGGGTTLALEFVDMDDARRDALDVLLARLLQTPVASSLGDLKPGTPPQDIKKALEAIPLPQRIALASRASAKEREYLRFDANAAVLEALVRNPGFTLAEARVIATSLQLLAGTLDVLSNDSRFKEDEELRIAIATHPRVSLGTAERVTADFKTPQLKKLLARPALNQLLREKLVRRTQR